MRTQGRGRWLARAAILLAFVCASAAAADEYPSHPIKLLVGFSAGGGLDISCRHWAQRLSARIGQPVIVENRPGASGVDINSYTGVAAPAKTPKAIVDLLNRHLNAVLQEPETAVIFAAQGYEVAGGSPEDFLRVIADDAATWSRVIRVADIKFE